MSKKHRKRQLPAHSPDKVREFIRHMLAGKPAREAAVAAGFVASQAGALCGKPEVRAALERERTAKDQILRHNPAGIEGQMGAIAFANFAEMFNPDGSMKPIHDIDPATRAAIAGFEMHSFDGPDGREHKVTKIKFAPRQPALRDLAQIHGLLGPEQLRTTINAPPFQINIHLGGAAEEAADRAADAAVEVPYTRLEHPPAGTYNRGSTWVADQPQQDAADTEAKRLYDLVRRPHPPAQPVPDLEAWHAYRQEQREARQLPKSKAREQQPAEYLKTLARQRRPGLANGLD